MVGHEQHNVKAWHHKAFSTRDHKWNTANRQVASVVVAYGRAPWPHWATQSVCVFVQSVRLDSLWVLHIDLDTNKHTRTR